MAAGAEASGQILDLAALQKLSGLKRGADIRRWLKANGVAHMIQPSGRPVSTLAAVNLAMLGDAKFSKPDFSPTPNMRRRRKAGST